ncbi:hypothetical protein EC991_002761 [Linnemannia zychae]|nr:hypothetical protein EC991_002761 [Linnemannia zychae]
MSTSPLPSYSNPCLAVTSQDVSTAYLFGVPETGENVVEVTVVNITDVSRPTVKASHSTKPDYQWTHDPEWNSNDQWKANAHKVCFPYLGDSVNLPGSPIHIQQLGENSTQQVVYFPITNTFDELDRFHSFGLLSRQSYTFINQAGFDSWVVGRINTTYAANDPTQWTSIQWDGRPDALAKGQQSWLPIRDTTISLTEDPLLTVGSFVAAPEVLPPIDPKSTVVGHLVVFDKMGAGSVYKTENIRYNRTMTTLRMTNLDSPQAVNMDGIKLTADAAYANINSGVFIMDKGDDGAVATYFIDPAVSNNLQRVSTLNQPPPFPWVMSVAAAGELIVLYAATKDGRARLHFLNATSKEWDKSYISIAGQDPVTTPKPEKNHIAAIAGAVGGIVLLVIGAYFFIRHRRKQRENVTNSSSSSINKYTDKKLLRSQQQPQFPARVGLAHGENFEIDVDVSHLGPQTIPLRPHHYTPPPPRVDPVEQFLRDHPQPPKVQSPHEWRHRPLVPVNNGIGGIIPLVQRRPPVPPPVPVRPIDNVHYTLVDENLSS